MERVIFEIFLDMKEQKMSADKDCMIVVWTELSASKCEEIVNLPQQDRKAAAAQYYEQGKKKLLDYLQANGLNVNNPLKGSNAAVLQGTSEQWNLVKEFVAVENATLTVNKIIASV